jgi:hypothetical protein
VGAFAGQTIGILVEATDLAGALHDSRPVAFLPSYQYVRREATRHLREPEECRCIVVRGSDIPVE